MCLPLLQGGLTLRIFKRSDRAQRRYVSGSGRNLTWHKHQRSRSGRRLSWNAQSGNAARISLSLHGYSADTRFFLNGCKRQEDSEPRAVAKLSHLLAIQTIRTMGPVSANSGESESSHPPW